MARNNFREKSKEEQEFEQSLVDVARVTRVKAGGKRLSFRALIVIGDKKGRVGAAIGKGSDVSIAVDKAVNRAKKNLIKVQIVKGTIAHDIFEKFKASKVLLKPAKQGRGVIAGGSVRVVLELAGVENVVSKIRGSSSKINNVFATINALKKLRAVEEKKEEEGPRSELKKEEKETTPLRQGFGGQGNKEIKDEKNIEKNKTKKQEKDGEEKKDIK